MSAKVKLSRVIEGIEGQGDELFTFLDSETGEVVAVWDYALHAAEEGEADEEEDGPAVAWRKEERALARAIVEDQNDRYLSLPDDSDINEWEMMQAFARGVDDKGVSETLQRAIHGRGAFRRFKDAAHRLGLADEWYRYRDQCYKNLAVQWCEDNGLAYVDDG